MRWKENARLGLTDEEKRCLQQTWDETSFRPLPFPGSHRVERLFQKKIESSDHCFTVGHILGTIANDLRRQGYFLPSVAAYTYSLPLKSQDFV